MKRADALKFLLSWAALAAVFFAAAPLAHAGEFLSGTERVSQGTASLVNIHGTPAETFQITYVDAKGVTRTKTVTTVRHPVSGIGQSFSTVPAAKGTTITVKNLSQPIEPPQSYIAQRFTPGSETAVTALAMDAGSTLTAFGQTFTLGGGFTTIATMADYDTASPGYGTLGGSIPSSFFDVFATLGSDQIVVQLDDSVAPFLLNVASSWDADMPDTGIAVPFTHALAGSLTYLGVTQPFIGSLTGNTTFFSDNFETIAGSIILDGIGTGVFSASGQTMMVPEPATLALVGIGLAGLGAMRRRKLA